MREMRTSASTNAPFVFAGILRQPLYPFRSGSIIASDAISSVLKNWTASTVCNNNRGCGTTAGKVTNHHQYCYTSAIYFGYSPCCVILRRTIRRLSLRA